MPTILVIFLIGFGVPALELSGVPTDPIVLGCIALGLCYGAYVAEVYRAGIESVHPSQRSAALAGGLTESQTMRHVVLPQAVRRVAPPLLNDFISLQKDVALLPSFAYSVRDGVSDFDLAAQVLGEHRATLPALVTHRVELDDIATAFDTAADKQLGPIKVAVTV